MNYMAIDIGGSTRNGIAIVDDLEHLIFSCNIPKDSKVSRGEHRRNVSAVIRTLCLKYDTKVIGLERIRLHRGSHISKLSSIVSLSKITGAIIDNCCDICNIYDYAVITWKSKILGNKSATKDDSVNYIKYKYKIEVCHDEADAICCAVFLAKYLNAPNNKIDELTEL